MLAQLLFRPVTNFEEISFAWFQIIAHGNARKKKPQGGKTAAAGERRRRLS
jgi:hypothetical protein